MELKPLLALFNPLLDALQFEIKVITRNMCYIKGYVPNAMDCGAMGLLFVSYGL